MSRRSRSVLAIFLLIFTFTNATPAVAGFHTERSSAELTLHPSQTGYKNLDLVFVMDTSESMDDEFNALCVHIQEIVADMLNLGITVRYEIMGITETRGCANSSVYQVIQGARVDQYEDWGPAVSDVSVGYSWLPGATRVIVPITDEAPQDGDDCIAPGSDQDAIDRAVTAAKANGVRVFPILGTPNNNSEFPCIEQLAYQLASSTSGAVYYSTTPSEDIATAIVSVIEKVIDDRDGDGIADADDPYPDDPCRPDPQAVCLPKQICGLSNTPHWDDDNDGRSDEEIMDGQDNDGDGLIDEDVGGVDCPFPDQDCGINSHRGFDDDNDGSIDEEIDNQQDDDGDNFIDEDIMCLCPAEQDLGVNETPGIDDDHDFLKDEELDDGIDNDGDGCIDEDIGISVDLDLDEVISNKQDLIQDMYNLGFTSKFTIFPIPFSAQSTPILFNSVINAENNVETWLSSMPSGDPVFNVAEYEAIYRLNIQEEALLNLWDSGMVSAHAANLQVSHVFLVVVSLLKNKSVLDHLDEVQLRGRLVTKVRLFFAEKLMKVTMGLIRWLVMSMDHPSAELIGDLIEQQMMLMEADFRNKLKSTNYTKDTLKDILENLVVEAIILPLDMALGKVLVDEIGDQIDIGLGEAKAISTSQINTGSVELNLAGISQGVDYYTTPILGRGNEVESDLEELQKDQVLAGITADYADAAFSVLKLASVTGVAAWLAGVVKVISILTRVIDALMSSYYMINWYDIYAQSYSAVSDVTNISFSRQISQIEDTNNYGYLSELLFSGENLTDLPLALSYSGSPPELGNHSLEQLNRLHSEIISFNELLLQLADFVKNGDIVGAEEIIEKIVEEDGTINSAFQIAVNPVYEGAQSLINGSQDGTADLYAQVGVNGTSFDAYSAGFYVSLLVWASDPDNEEIQTLLLGQIDQLSVSSKDYQDSIVSARPYVEAFATKPGVLITGYTVPEEIQSRVPFIITVELTNPAPEDALGVVAAIKYENGKGDVVEEEVSIGTMAAESTISIDFQIPCDLCSSLAIIKTEVDNGYGDSRMAPLPVEVKDCSSSTGAVTPPGGGNSGFIIILALVAFGVLGVYLVNQRRKTTKKSSPGHLITHQGEEISLFDGFMIGRGSTSHYRIADESVSRKHAQFRFTDGAWFIQDLGSSGGTFINGQQMQAKRLISGDQIQIGNTTLAFKG